MSTYTWKHLLLLGAGACLISGIDPARASDCGYFLSKLQVLEQACSSGQYCSDLQAFRQTAEQQGCLVEALRPVIFPDAANVTKGVGSAADVGRFASRCLEIAEGAKGAIRQAAAYRLMFRALGRISDAMTTVRVASLLKDGKNAEAAEEVTRTLVAKGFCAAVASSPIPGTGMALCASFMMGQVAGSIIDVLPQALGLSDQTITQKWGDILGGIYGDIRYPNPTAADINRSIANARQRLQEAAQQANLRAHEDGLHARCKQQPSAARP